MTIEHDVEPSLTLVNEWRFVMEVVIGAAPASFGRLGSSTVLAGAAVFEEGDVKVHVPLRISGGEVPAKWAATAVAM